MSVGFSYDPNFTRAPQLYVSGPALPYASISDLLEDIGVYSSSDVDDLLSALGSDDIDNDSTILGDTVSAALDQLGDDLDQLATDVYADLQPLDSTLTALSALSDASGVLTNDGSGNLSWAAGGGGELFTGGTSLPYASANAVLLELANGVAVTQTELGYLDGVTSAIQTQLNGKLATPSMTSDYVPKWNGAALVDSALQFASSNAILAGALAWDTGYNRFVGPNGTANDLYMVANGLLVFSAGGTSQRANISSTGLAVGLGTTAASAMLHARSTTDQMWLEYSSGVYAKFNVGSGGRTKAYSSNVDDSWWIGYSDSACIQLSFSSFLPSISTPNGYLRLFGGASGTYLSLGTNNSNELRLSEGNKMGFFATAPAARVTGFGVTNASTRKTFDTTSVTLPQLAEVVGTLIAALGSTAIDGITGVGLIGTT